MTGVIINFDADPSGALDGTSQVEESVSDLSRALGDLGDESRDAGDDLGASLADAGDAAEDALEGVGDGAELSGREIRAVGRISKEALEGDLAGAASAALPLLAGLGPAAAIGGAAAVVAIDGIAGALDGGKAAAAEMAEAISAAFKTAAEDGRAYLTEAQIQAIVMDTIWDTSKAEDARAEAAQISVDFTTYVRAQAGDQRALNTVLERTNELLRARREELQGRPGDIQTGASAEETDQTLYALQRILEENEAIAGSVRENEERARAFAEVVSAGRDNWVSMRDVINDIPAEVPTKVTVDSTEVDAAVKKLTKGIVVPVKFKAPYGGIIG